LTYCQVLKIAEMDPAFRGVVIGLVILSAVFIGAEVLYAYQDILLRFAGAIIGSGS
jgi:hypothetical protein